MADTLTAKLSLVKPEVGASADSWGAKQNAAMDIIDAAIMGDPATVASSATMDLTATTVPTLNVTGSATISSLGAGKVGMIRNLIFAGAPLLDHSANFVLPGGQDLQASAGDTATVVCTAASTWKMLRYQANAAPQPVPIGAGADYWGVTAPAGWLMCYGQAVSRTTYAALFAVIGTVYGVGDGSTTFNIPDARGRVTAGQDDMGGVSANRLTGITGSVDGDVLGGTGGEEAHALLLAENAAHTHTGTTSNASVNHQHGGGPVSSVTGSLQSSVQGGAGNGGSDGTDQPSGSLHTHTFTSASSGSGTAHNNVQPTIVANKIIFAGV